MTTNTWCAALGIAPPRLEAFADHREANTFSLLLVALLERGGPMTLAQVASRFAQAGIADRRRALLSLQRCKPGRPPVYREGDLYHLDPHDDDLDLWAFRLGLRPPRYARPPREPAPAPTPLPAADVPLTAAELDQAWTDASLSGWSAQRLALAVLDASAKPMRPTEIAAEVGKRTRWHSLRVDTPGIGRRGSAIALHEDGCWAIAPDATAALQSTRAAVRKRVALARHHAAARPTAQEVEEATRLAGTRRAAHAAELAKLSRALLVAFPPARPEAVALLDVRERTITTYLRAEFGALRQCLGKFDVLGAMDVRQLLRSLEVDPAGRRLADLGPPQKTMRLNRGGRTLKLTAELLVRGSCGLPRPFGDERTLRAYLASGAIDKLLRRLEADVKSLYALHEYGRLHGAVRVRWGFLDERVPAPWVHRDEPTLFDLKRSALAAGVPLEIVAGAAPGWAEPWARARKAFVAQGSSRYETWLVDEAGMVVDDADVQLARLATSIH